MNLLKVTCLASVLSIIVPTSFSQGCVAIRGGGACSGNFGSTINLHKGEWNPQFGFRYFKSFRHFMGDHQETHRIEEGTQVINDSYFTDFSVAYGITDRLYAAVTVPFVFHNRSSMYEHGGNPPNGLGERHETSSYGLSDIRLGMGYWLFNPEKRNFNYAVGLGVKLPTGKYDYTDTFYNQGPNKDEDVERVVDQSIQPGDGGTGIAVELNGYHPVSHTFAIRTIGYYLINFKETNGVLTRNGSSEFSCPDQFSFRTGAFYNSMKGFSGYFGGLIEGVPSDDLIGGSAGYRRPGYAVSVEPGFGYFRDNLSVLLTVPVALYRNRTQSFSDKETTALTGVYRHGDAAFADYLINFSLSYRFGGKKKEASPE